MAKAASTSHSTPAPKAPSDVTIAKDRLAYLISKRQKLFRALYCGILLAWFTSSICVLPSSFTRWRILLALGVLVLSLVQLWVAGLVAAAIWTVQMFLIHPPLGLLTAAFALVFAVSFRWGYAPWSSALAAPLLVSCGMGVVVPVGLGMVTVRKQGWFWAGLAFLLCAFHAFVFGNELIGVQALPSVARIVEEIGKDPAGFPASIKIALLNSANVTPLRADFMRFLVTTQQSIPVGIQLVLWIGAAMTAGTLLGRRKGSLLGRRSRLNRLAMDYLAKVSGGKRNKIRWHQRVVGVLTIAGGALLVGYIVLGIVCKNVDYGIGSVLLDCLALSIMGFPLAILLEGIPEKGRLSKTERLEEHYGEAFKDLPIGDRGQMRRKSPERPRPATPAAGRSGKGPAPARNYLQQAAAVQAIAKKTSGSGAMTRAPAATAQTGPGGTRSAVEAVVFLDMVGSTSMGSKYGDDFVLALKENLKTVVTGECRREKVLFSKGTGDGYMLTFPEAENAVRAAIEIMAGVKKLNEGTPEPRWINLRFGIHLGQVNIDSGGDRLGTAANFAARIEGVKPEQFQHSEQEEIDFPLKNRIFVSEVVAQELAEVPTFEFRPLGYFEFKGISGLHRLYQVTEVH